KFTLNGKSYTGVGGLPVALAYALSLGPSGFPFYGSDTGGYIHSPPNRELFLRWTQFNALSAVMEVGDSSSQTPWEFTPENGRDQGGVEVTVPAPVEKLPLLVRAGGIVPMLRPTIDTMSPTTIPARVDSFATHAGLLYARVAPGPANTFTVYDGARIGAAPGMITLAPGNAFNQG